METSYSISDKLLRSLATLVSYLLHPLFIPTYIFWFLTWQFPYEFAGITVWQLKLRLFAVFWMTAFFPAFAVFLMARLKLIESMLLRTQKDRIIPFFVSMFFYWWMYYLSRNFTDQPIVLKFFYFGIFISTAVGVFLNNYMKISLHGIGAGGAVAAMILFAFYYQLNLGLAISITVMLAGLISTCRLALGEHKQVEVYAGFLTGLFCQLFSYWFIL